MHGVQASTRRRPPPLQQKKRRERSLYESDDGERNSSSTMGIEVYIVVSIFQNEKYISNKLEQLDFLEVDGAISPVSFFSFLLSLSAV